MTGEKKQQAQHTQPHAQSQLSFEHMAFEDLPDAKEPAVRVFFHKYFTFDIPRARLEEIGLVAVERETLSFGTPEKRAESRMRILIENGLQRLHNLISDRHCVYVHRGSGIPLVGSNEFGVVDRGSNIIEVKPLTGCNLKCIFCSVGEGRTPETADWTDFLVEEAYLVDEVAKACALKKHPVEVNIGPQGEPLLYPDLLDLIRDLKAIPQVQVISINTNGVLLTPKLVDELAAAGLSRINLSLHALDQDLAQKLMGAPYSLQHILDVIAYCKKTKKIAVLLAPVLVPGMNEQEMERLVQLAKTLESEWPTIGIQNFLNYKHGRNPVEAKPLEEFFTDLAALEKKTGAPLLLKTGENPFRIFPEESLPKPFKKDDLVQARIACVGRHPGEMVAVAKGRVITLLDSRKKPGDLVTVCIVRDKHNIFKGVLAKGPERLRSRMREEHRERAGHRRRKARAKEAALDYEKTSAAQRLDKDQDFEEPADADADTDGAATAAATTLLENDM